MAEVTTVTSLEKYLLGDSDEVKSEKNGTSSKSCQQEFEELSAVDLGKDSLSTIFFKVLGITKEVAKERYGDDEFSIDRTDPKTESPPGPETDFLADIYKSPELEPSEFMQVSQINWESKIIWDSTAPCWDWLKPAPTQKSATESESLECWARGRQGLSGRNMPWIPITVARPQSSSDKEDFVSWFKPEVKALQNFESDIIWYPEQVAKLDEGAPQKRTLELSDVGSLRQRLLEYDEEMERMGSTYQDSDRGKQKGPPHKHKTEALLGRYGFLKRSDEDQRYCQDTEIGPKSKFKKDPYNISNDEYYMPPSAASPKLAFPHATPVTYLRRPFIPTNLGPNTLRKFHRPSANLLVHGAGPHRINALTKRILKRAKARAKEATSCVEKCFNTVEDLSGKDGTMVLIEYCEQFPPLLSQIGMCSELVNYYKKPPPGTNVDPPVMALGHHMDIRTSPFLGAMHSGQLLQAIENNMYRAPIYAHKRSDTDFVLLISRNGFSIRDYDHLFAAGQECPLIEVPSPNSRMATKYISDLLQIYIYRLFSKSKDRPRRLEFQDLKILFPTFPESTIRKRLKSCADFMKAEDENVYCWILKEDVHLPNEEEIKVMITPEQCCAYLSCLAGEQRLRDAGYGTESVFSLEDEREECSNRKIEDEVNFAPWNTTKAFIGAMKGKFVLDISGQADPTGIGEGFSYTKLVNRYPKEDMLAQEKGAVRGTDADLRKLGTNEAKEILRKFGVPQNEILKLNRWEIIDVIRTMSTKKTRCGEGGYKFSRGKISTMSMNVERYREESQRIFEVQNRVLSAETPLTSDEEESSDEEEEDTEGGGTLEQMGKSVEQMLFENKTRQEYTFEREEEERKELRRMILNNEIIQSDKAQAKLEENDKKIQSLTSKPGRVLRIQRVFKHPTDGSEYTRTELVRSPSVIDIYVRMRATKNETFIRRFVFANDQDRLRKEKRRLQDQIRRIKRGQVQGNKVERPKNPNEPTSLKVTCSACRQAGHMKTNKSCPLFTESSLNGRLAENEMHEECENKMKKVTDGVKLDGTKFHVNMEDLKRQTAAIKMRKDELDKIRNKKRLEDDFDYYRRHPQTCNRMRLNPQVLISNIFDEILNAMRDDVASTDFIKPVSKRVPNYHEMIQTPMCIQFMREKVRDRKYESRADFLRDTKLLVDNSSKYNGDQHEVTACARKIYEIAERLIEERSAELYKYEKIINPLLDEDSKRRLNYILGKIVDQIKSSPDAYPFLRPLSKKTYKAYYQMIEHPMDLELISFKIEQCAYKSRFELLKDVDLIQFNAVKFNGFEHTVAQQAASLTAAFHKALQPLDAHLTQLEIKIKKDHNDNDIDHGERELERPPKPEEIPLSPEEPPSPAPVVVPLNFSESLCTRADSASVSALRKRSRSEDDTGDGDEVGVKVNYESDENTHGAGEIQPAKKAKLDQHQTDDLTEKEAEEDQSHVISNQTQVNKTGNEQLEDASDGIDADLAVSDSSDED